MKLNFESSANPGDLLTLVTAINKDHVIIARILPRIENQETYTLQLESLGERSKRSSLIDSLLKVKVDIDLIALEFDYQTPLREISGYSHVYERLHQWHNPKLKLHVLVSDFGNGFCAFCGLKPENEYWSGYISE